MKNISLSVLFHYSFYRPLCCLIVWLSSFLLNHRRYYGEDISKYKLSNLVSVYIFRASVVYLGVDRQDGHLRLFGKEGLRAV